MPRAALEGRAGRTFSDVLATIAPTGVMVPNGGTPGACANSADDESNIELFNMWSYMEEFEIQISGIDPGATTPPTIALDCPERPSPTIGTTLGIGLFLAGQETGVGCNGAGIALDRTTLLARGYPECVVRSGVPSCRVTLIAWNTVTQVIYSETQIMLVLNGNQTMIPDLNPATRPLCNNTLNDCLLEGTCVLSTQQEGQLRLCESPTSCSALPPSPGWGVSDSIYFQTAIRDATGP
ncbi:MAG: hypothetical protein ACKO7U_02475 [Actinomycetota bacterium]